MIRDLDIYRSANVLIREHGEDAALDQPYPAVAVAALIQFPAEGEERRLVARHLDHFAQGQLAACTCVGTLVRNKHRAQNRRRPWMDLGTSDKRLNDWRRGAAAELVLITVHALALHHSGPSNHISASVA